MKRLHLFLALGLATASATAAASDSMSLNAFKSHVLPVLVQVDSAGKVTDVASSSRLSPQFDRLLRSSLDEMISKPATKHGHPIASQFVINLALNVTPRDDGEYDASFAYVSANPVPSGQWYWEHQDGHRLALINRNSLRQWQRPMRNFPSNSSWHSYSTPRTFNSAPQQPQTASHAAASQAHGK